MFSTVLTAAVVLVMFGVLVWRAEPLVREYMQRSLAVKEAAMALDTSVKAAPSKPEALPADLEMFVEGESMPWAREQVRAALQDAYQAHGDWDHIRSQVFG